jgi:hypothetical protein
VMEENLIKLKLSMIPYVDDEEMKEIEKIFGDPEKYKDQRFLKLDLYNMECKLISEFEKKMRLILGD